MKKMNNKNTKWENDDVNICTSPVSSVYTLMPWGLKEWRSRFPLICSSTRVGFGCSRSRAYILPGSSDNAGIPGNFNPWMESKCQCSLITLTGSLTENQYVPCSEKPVHLAGLWCLLLHVLHKTNVKHFIISPLFIWGLNTADSWNHTPTRLTYVLQILTVQVFDRHLSGHEQGSPGKKNTLKSWMSKNLVVVWALSLIGERKTCQPNLFLNAWPFTVWSNAILPYLLQFQKSVSDKYCKSSDNSSEQWFLHGSHVYRSKVKLGSTQLHYSWS